MQMIKVRETVRKSKNLEELAAVNLQVVVKCVESCIQNGYSSFFVVLFAFFLTNMYP